jgi:hypothetical protein
MRIRFVLLLLPFAFSLFPETTITDKIIEEKHLYFQGLTAEREVNPGVLSVAVPALAYAGSKLSREDISTITSLFSASLVNSYSFIVLERKYLNSILDEQKFQLSGITDQETMVELGKLINLSGFFMGEILDGEDDFTLTLYYVDSDKGEIKFQFDSQPFLINQLDTFLDKFMLEITTEMGVTVPVRDIDTGSIIAISRDRKNAVINIGEKNVEPGIEMGVQKGFIYVLYREGEEVTRGIVTQVSPLHSQIHFNRELPPDTLSSPLYELHLYGYLPPQSWYFSGPLALSTNTFSKGLAGFQTEMSYQVMTQKNIAFDFTFGYIFLYNNNLVDTEIEDIDGSLMRRNIITPFGISYYFRNLNSYSLGLGVSGSLDYALYYDYNGSSGVLPVKSKISIVPSFYLKLIPDGRITMPEMRTSAVQFCPMVRVVPLPDDFVLTLGMGILW